MCRRAMEALRNKRLNMRCAFCWAIRIGACLYAAYSVRLPWLIATAGPLAPCRGPRRHSSRLRLRTAYRNP